MVRFPRPGTRPNLTSRFGPGPSPAQPPALTDDGLDNASRVPVLLVATAVALSLAHFVRNAGAHGAAAALLVCSVLILASAAFSSDRPIRPEGRWGRLVAGLTIASLTLYVRDSLNWLDLNHVVGAGHAAAVSILLVGAGAALTAVVTRNKTIGVAAALVMIASNAGVGWIVASTGDLLAYDVVEFQRIAASTLLEGGNPYAAEYPDIYSPELSARFYGEGISVDGVLTRGFPYPPTSLIPVVPAYVMGDVQVAHRIAIPVVALILLALSGGSVLSRIGVVMILTAPAVVNLPVGSWTEPFLAVALASSVWAYRNRHAVAPFMLGLFFSLKQYTVLFLPLIPVLVASGGVGTTGRSRWRSVALGLAPWAALTLAFVMWGPSAFFESVITWQFEQPFRPDSLSLLVWAVTAVDWPPPWSYSVVPVLAGLAAGGVFLWKAKRSPAGFALGVAFAMACFLLLSKQAFANYYFIVVTGCAVAVASHEAA